MTKILYVNSNDKMGQRFSGIDWFEKLEEAGFSPGMLIGREKSSRDERIQSYKDKTPVIFKNAVKYFEWSMSRQSFLSPTYLELSLNREFKKAELVHYQVVHDGSWFRIEDLPRLTSRKPSIWTWHDAWPVTGHCTQPLDCPQFKNNCSTCPHLDWPMALRKDTARSERIRKNSVISKSNVNIHVTTNWMAKLVLDSGNHDNLDVKVIPFGLDVSRFNSENRKEIRQKYGLNEETFVIGIRMSDWVVKNTALFLNVINSLCVENRNIEIFTYDKVDSLWEKRNLPSNIRVRDFGWLDDATLIDTYKCLNVFLGISVGESFGFMPVEAAACGAVPISIRATAVSEFVSKIDPILAIKNDELALKYILEKLISDKSMYEYEQMKSLKVIQDEYTLDRFIGQLSEFYKEVIEKSQNA